ncbi:MAG: GPR endopeptidase, partial [Oscillospiraceae bacterium]
MKDAKIRTDLALEAADTGDGKIPSGVFVTEIQENGVKKTSVEIRTAAAAKRLGRKKGRYITLEGDFSQKSEMANKLEESVKEMLPSGSVLVVGFGNQQITPDTIGPLSAQKIMATSHLPLKMKETFGLDKLRDVSVIFPGAMGQTGI